MQVLHAGACVTFLLPPAADEVLPGIPWGRFEDALTPAFWAARVRLRSDTEGGWFRLGATLREEVAAALLCGYGVPAEIGMAAFARVRDSGLLGNPETNELERALSSPFPLGAGTVRYRFARQKAAYVAGALHRLEVDDVPTDDRALRAYLTTLPGIGLKTASLITRNVLDSDKVAILDIHICRACAAVGVFPRAPNPQRAYVALEERFLAFAAALGVRSSRLDAVMWVDMRRMGGAGRSLAQSLEGMYYESVRRGNY